MRNMIKKRDKNKNRKKGDEQSKFMNIIILNSYYILDSLIESKKKEGILKFKLKKINSFFLFNQIKMCF